MARGLEHNRIPIAESSDPRPLLGIATDVHPRSAPHGRGMTRVETVGGLIRGRNMNGVAVFKGIPYAAPPLGELRFRPPQPVAPWSQDLDATGQPAACPQPALPRLFDKLDRSDPATKFVERYDEDCLTLSLWTPAPDSAARPVLVWLHGGWFSVGSGNEPCYDGTNLCRAGDVVVVSVTHRLGALGFLSPSEPDDERFASSANNGILDIVAALEWVRDNISRFGGDPTCVTMFGESGGASKISALLGVPQARGLFHRAVLQSGPLLRAVERDQAQATTKAFLAEVGAGSMSELQEVPVARLLNAQSRLLGGPLGGLYGGGHRMAPTVDNHVLHEHPWDPVAAPASRGVPLLIGSCRDEATMLVATVPGIDEVPPERQAIMLADQVFGHALDDLLAGYARTRPTASAVECFLAAATDQLRIGGITIAERATAAGAPAYLYRLDYVPPVLGGKLGAAHTADIGLVFANVDAGAGITSPNRGLYAHPEVPRLSEEMSRAWIAFARTGDPGHPGLPEWPTYEADRRATMIFGTPTAVVDDPDAAERLLWRGRDGGM